MQRNRGVSPVISTILMVTIAVVLAATVSVFVLDIGEDVQDPAPTVGQSSGTLIGGGGSDAQIVRITHVAGDNLDIQNVDIVVEAPPCDPASARITNLPASSGGFDSENIAYGADLIDESSGQAEGVLDQREENTFESGSFLKFRINGGTANCNGGAGLLDDDVVTVKIVHRPSDAIIIEKDLRVAE